ncbi:WxcM-like domain-containing protein [Chryseobacterium sp. SNU WT5]|uniref:WxcM-like domain-containing protein n=1 Tax=Chryseobacterium sp. SNU WT5 TaxID=2594269 RepID=UPI001E2D17F8|nr:WxcM-like domain-containing protein [Chryseobacterium sp. SNU WT5]
MEPELIKGNNHLDDRGKLTFNNDFCGFTVKKMYSIENYDLDFVRGWQGHQVEQRWFSAVTGSFKIKLIRIDKWENPARNLPIAEFHLNAQNFDILHIPSGFVTSIQALEKSSKLLVFGDYQLNELQDEFRFPNEYFNA